MPDHAPIAIKEALDKIQKQHYVLPAVQREFVWTNDQITQVFDGPLHASPIWSFPCWS